jgi:hypothetical protein
MPFQKGHKINVGRKCLEETKKKIGLANIGKVSPIKGKKLSKEHCNNISEGRKKRKEELGYLNSPETRKKISKSCQGRPGYWLGKKRPPFSKETRKKQSISHTGNKNYNWIEDRTKIKKQEDRNNPNDKQWKYSVYKRDNFKCRINNQDCKGKIEAHHILSWSNFPELRYEINNGISLCHFHHPRKRNDEIKFAPIFKELVKTTV